MNISKKILAVAISVLMIISVMPFAFAVDAATGDFADAIANAEAGAKVTLTDDVALNGSITIDKKVIIDLNGKTITTTTPDYASPMFIVTETGDLEFTSTGTGNATSSTSITEINDTNIKVTNPGKVITAKRVVKNSGIVTFTKGIFEGDDIVAVMSGSTTTVAGAWLKGNDGAIFTNAACTGATINLNSGVISATDNAPVMFNGQATCNSNTFNLKSGYLLASMLAEDVAKGYMAMGLYLPSNNVANIKGGYIKAINGAGIVVRGGTLNVTGGTVIATGDTNGKCGDAKTYPTSNAIVVDAKAMYPAVDTLDINISGGTIQADIAPIGCFDSDTIQAADAVAVTGGTFKANGAGADVSRFIDPASNLVVTSAGKVTTAYFEMNGTKYAYVADAVAKAPTDGTPCTITLLSDVSISGQGGAKVLAGQNITFDLDGHTWTLRGTVGSTGTVTNGFQLLKGSTVKFIDGTVTAKLATIYTVIQNYGDLTIENCTIAYTSSGVNKTTVSTNCSDVVIKNSTIIGATSSLADPNNSAIGITPGWAADYKEASIVIENTAISGDVKVDAESADSSVAVEFKGTTTLTNGEIKLPDEVAGTFVVTNNGTNVAPAEGYKWIPTADGKAVLGLGEDIDNGQNLTVEDVISQNVYIDVDAYENIDKTQAVLRVYRNLNADVSETPNWGYEEISLAEGVEYESIDEYDGTYKFAFQVAPAQLSEQITVELLDKHDGTVIDTLQTSAADLCKQGVTSSDTNYANLCKAMLDYARACQIMFNYNTDDMVIDAYYNTDITNDAFMELDRPQGGTFGGVSCKGLNITAVSAFQWNFFTSSDVTEQKCTLVTGDDTDAYAISRPINDKDCIRVKGVEPANFGKLMNVVTADGTIRLSVNNVCNSLLNLTNDANLQALARAVYFYGVAAAAYFG